MIGGHARRQAVYLIFISYYLPPLPCVAIDNSDQPDLQAGLVLLYAVHNRFIIRLLARST